MATHSPAALLPFAAPSQTSDRLLLFAIRRIADGGLTDAYAASAMLDGFGRGFRRPLVLLRAMMAEMSRISAHVVMVAPCCCPRATADERRLLDVVAIARLDPRDAQRRLSALLHVRHCHAATAAAQALAQAFADLGRPLEPSDY